MLRSTAIVLGILGLPMIWVGAELALMGGTPYYLVTGLLMTFSAVDFWRKRKRGFYVFAGALLLTLAWAVYEAQFEFWLVGSRIWLIGLLALWLSTPTIRRQLWDDDLPALLSMRTVKISLVAI